MDTDIVVRVADAGDADLALPIAAEMEAGAKARGTGISRRDPRAIREKIMQGKAIIAFSRQGVWAGFSYLEAWEEGRFVSNSGLIVPPAFRGKGIAAAIKRQLVELCRRLYPQARLFGITTGGAVMKINHRMGFVPVTYGEITRDARFWEGCRSCVNYDILRAKGFRNCLCTAMLYDPGRV